MATNGPYATLATLMCTHKPLQFQMPISRRIIPILARWLYAQMWKCVDVPKEDTLKDKIYEVVEMDVLTGRMREGNLDKIQNYWKPFYVWIRI